MSLKPLWKVFAAAALLIGTGQIAVAATATTNVPVTSSVSKNCSMTLGGAVAFGAYDPTSATALNATGSIVVRCTKGATGLTIGMNNGLHFSGTVRQMIGTTSGDFLQFALFQPPDNTPGTACTFPGTALQDVSVDSYTDTVVATVNF